MVEAAVASHLEEVAEHRQQLLEHQPQQVEEGGCLRLEEEGAQPEEGHLVGHPQVGCRLEEHQEGLAIQPFQPSFHPVLP